MNNGKRLKMWRQRLRWSQKEVATVLGVSRQLIGALESGAVSTETSRVAPLIECLFRDMEWRGLQGWGMATIRKVWL